MIKLHRLLSKKGGLNLRLLKAQTIKFDALSNKELSKFYTTSERGHSTDGSEQTVYFRLFPKRLVSSMEMAFAINSTLERRYYRQFMFSKDFKRLYDGEGRRLDGSPDILKLDYIHKIKANVPAQWDAADGDFFTVSHILDAARALKVDLTYKKGKVSDIIEDQVLRSLEIDDGVLDCDILFELHDDYLILHWDSTA